MTAASLGYRLPEAVYCSAPADFAHEAMPRGQAALYCQRRFARWAIYFARHAVPPFIAARARRDELGDAYLIFHRLAVDDIYFITYSLDARQGH